MSSRIHKRQVIVCFVIKGYDNKHGDYAVVYNIVTLNHSEGFVSCHSNPLVPTGITTVTTYY